MEQIKKKIDYLRQLIGKLQMADNVNDETYLAATIQLSSLYEEVANV